MKSFLVFHLHISAESFLIVECLFKINQAALIYIAKKLKEDFFREKTKTTDGRIITEKVVVRRKNEYLIYLYI